MTYNVRIRPDAESDIEDAAQWYELQRQGLGHEFMDSVEHTLNRIRENPSLYPVVHRNSRRTSPRSVILELINTGGYAKTLLPFFEDLRGLRNEAAHAPHFVPANKQTRRYLQMAMELALTLQNPLKPTNQPCKAGA